MPGAYLKGSMGGMINFPSWLGKRSSEGKKDRLLQELKKHMNLKISGTKTALNLDYLEHLRTVLTKPLIENGSNGIPSVMARLEHYCLRKEDIEAINEVSLWSSQRDPMSQIDSKVKAALTRSYNKEGFALPYSLNTITKGRKRGAASEMFDDDENASLLNEDDEEGEEIDEIELDAMIKAKKKSSKAKETTKVPASKKAKAQTKQTKQQGARQSKAKV